jgi:hypothetical protein
MSSAAAANKKVRHIIVAPNGNTYETHEGLAFAIGVACVECETTRIGDEGAFYRIQHPNGVDIYHVAYIGDTAQVIVTKVGAH